MSNMGIGYYRLDIDDVPEYQELLSRSKTAARLYLIAKKERISVEVTDQITCFGLYYPGTSKIKLSSSVNPEFSLSTFSHEMVHYLQHKGDASRFKFTPYNRDRYIANRLWIEIAAYNIGARVADELGFKRSSPAKYKELFYVPDVEGRTVYRGIVDDTNSLYSSLSEDI